MKRPLEQGEKSSSCQCGAGADADGLLPIYHQLHATFEDCLSFICSCLLRALLQTQVMRATDSVKIGRCGARWRGGMYVFKKKKKTN